MNGAILWALLSIVGAPGHVLGPEAEGVVAPWSKGLTGLRIESIQIAGGGVDIRLEPACTLRLMHPADGNCPSGTRWGNALVCWEGERCPPATRRASALARAGKPKLPWRAPPGDGMRGQEAGDAPRRSLVEARERAQERLDVRDTEGATQELMELLGQRDLRPEDLLSVLPALGVLGEGARALGITGSSTWEDMDPGLLALCRLSLLMGPHLAATAAPTVLDPPMACRAASVGSAFVMVGRWRSAATLGAAIRARAPGCWGAYGVEAEALAHRRDGDGLTALLEEARKHFPATDERIQALEEMAWLAKGKTAEVVRRLEGRVEAGDRSPGVFKDLLALYVAEELRSEKIATWVSRAEKDPADPVASFFAGVLLHYEKRFRRSQELLAVAARELPEEPRLHIYRAMNAFNLGERELAERSIEEAGRLEAQDPDVHYCRGEIYRDTQPRKALAALETYWHQTSSTSDASSRKQVRVRGLIAALEACLERREPGPCPGPWEHTFGSAREP